MHALPITLIAAAQTAASASSVSAYKVAGLLLLIVGVIGLGNAILGALFGRDGS